MEMIKIEGSLGMTQIEDSMEMIKIEGSLEMTQIEDSV